jgi:hypothetical protein
MFILRHKILIRKFCIVLMRGELLELYKMLDRQFQKIQKDL